MTQRDELTAKDAQDYKLLVFNLNLSQRNLYFDPILNFAVPHLFHVTIQCEGNMMYK